MISLRYLTPSSIFCTFYSFFNSQTEAQIKTLKEEKRHYYRISLSVASNFALGKEDSAGKGDPGNSGSR